MASRLRGPDRQKVIYAAASPAVVMPRTLSGNQPAWTDGGECVRLHHGVLLSFGHPRVAQAGSGWPWPPAPLIAQFEH